MNIFKNVSLPKNKYNKFNLSHRSKFTCNMGYIIPTFVQDVLPGDVFEVKQEHRIQLSPLIAPVFAEMDVYEVVVEVPLRLIWDDSQEFFTGGELGLSEIVPPQIHFDGQVTTSFQPFCSPRSLADYLGLATLGEEEMEALNALDFTYDALPFRAVSKFYNDWCRDENLEDEIPFSTASGIEEFDISSHGKMMSLHTKAWNKDYLTSALPFVQRGPSVKLPITQGQGITSDGTMVFRANPSAQSIGEGEYFETLPAGTTNAAKLGVANTLGGTAEMQYQSGLKLQGGEVGTINELRTAMATQRWYEVMARGGARYVEQIRSIFGVRSSDARLQRSRILMSSKSPIMISEITQTSESNQTPLGQPAGKGLSVSSTKKKKFFFEEHGLMIGFMAIVPKADYFQGMPRKYLRKDKFDYFWPQFAHIGEQAVQKGEVKFNFFNEDLNDDTFGYQSRYSEYKFNFNRIHGEFKTNLDFWHLARKFSGVPALNANFVHCIPSQDDLQRIWAVTDQNITDHFWCEMYHSLIAKRQIPIFSEPH